MVQNHMQKWVPVDKTVFHLYSKFFVMVKYQFYNWYLFLVMYMFGSLM